ASPQCHLSVRQLPDPFGRPALHAALLVPVRSRPEQREFPTALAGSVCESPWPVKFASRRSTGLLSPSSTSLAQLQPAFAPHELRLPALQRSCWPACPFAPARLRLSQVSCSAVRRNEPGCNPLRPARVVLPHGPLWLRLH